MRQESYLQQLCVAQARYFIPSKSFCLNASELRFFGLIRIPARSPGRVVSSARLRGLRMHGVQLPVTQCVSAQDTVTLKHSHSGAFCHRTLTGAIESKAATGKRSAHHVTLRLAR
ncbi:hypothetical protein AAFF_G00034500 [Aldrovandia affinis]|uniref:Uncharacterized protein n=1 Tax=Aldrovandia affinis TaxID=143900 RepID=A0AAD7WFU2_9TELE|nr:hypothetical protein AAFF_G00034500 [Aldrovandia affinis]